MSIQHIKSPCCGAHSINYGKRRRQCSSCRTTWRIRRKKRGRKIKRVSPQLAVRLFETKSTIRQRAEAQGLSERQYQYRMMRSLAHINGYKWYDLLPQRSKFILLIDGIWAHCNGKRVVVYLLALRSIKNTQAILLPPHVMTGTETHKKWQTIIDDLPVELQNQIVALVCDGLTGMTEQAQWRGWVVQRCQFHFIKTIERFRGKKNQFVKNKRFRENMYQAMRKALVMPEGNQLQDIFATIEQGGRYRHCPFWIKPLVKELVRYRHEFRAYIMHPELQLPATNGAMESLAGVVRHRLYLARGFKTIQSLSRWMRGLIISKHHIICNPTDQPN